MPGTLPCTGDSAGKTGLVPTSCLAADGFREDGGASTEGAVAGGAGEKVVAPTKEACADDAGQADTKGAWRLN